MISRRYLVFAVLAALLSLSSCSGTKNRCTTNCGGRGNAMLSVSISDTPPANTTVVSFTLPIIGISLTSSSGSQVSVFSSSTAANFELTRLQADSDVVVTNASVAAGTYTAVNVTLGAASGTFINNSGAAVGACPAASPFSVCGLPNGVATTITAPISVTLTGGAHQWLDLDFNYNNAIVTTNGIGINMQQSNVLTATTTVPTGIPSGDFANVDDFTGRVTAVTSSSITLSSTVRGSLTATINGSTQVFDPQSPAQCSGTATLACIKVGSIVSLQGVLTNTGAIVATSLDVIDSSTTPVDEVEGTIYPSTCKGTGSIGMIISDSSIVTTSSPLASAGFGSGVCLTLGPTASFVIDFGILTGQPGLPAATGPGFRTASDLLAGQTIRAKVTGAATGTNSLINATATAMILRFSRLTGTVGTVSGPAFTINGLPTYITAFTVPPSVQTYTNATLFENAATLSGTVSISALFYNPVGGPTQPLQAAKVRQP
jgi:Domain of unknown function (DUF4382)/Domain of unknown function (DUF5666)